MQKNGIRMAGKNSTFLPLKLLFHFITKHSHWWCRIYQPRWKIDSPWALSGGEGALGLSGGNGHSTNSITHTLKALDGIREWNIKLREKWWEWRKGDKYDGDTVKSDVIEMIHPTEKSFRSLSQDQWDPSVRKDYDEREFQPIFKPTL